MAQKMLVGDKDTVLLIPATEINGVPYALRPSTGTALPITAITSDLLNEFIGITTPNDAGAHWGGNVTCAVVDDWKLALKDSSTKDIKTLCSVGQASELTFFNYDAQMNFLRDVDPHDGDSEFNLPIQLTSAPDVAYIIAHRDGYASDAATATGQDWNFYYAWTDFAIPVFADGDYQEVGETFVPKGIINFGYALEA
jgi:hypothetical protein